MNRGLCTSLLAVGAAQLLKVPFHYAKTGKWQALKMIGSGGMPSSHASGVSALAAYTGVRYGVKTPEFAVAAMLGIIVMYDAMNIRRHAGEIAVQVNDLDEHMEKLSGKVPGIGHERREKQLKETLGHQPIEVSVGALFGAAIGSISALTNRR